MSKLPDFDWRAFTPDDSPLTPMQMMADPVVKKLSTPDLAVGDPAYDFQLPICDFREGVERETAKVFHLGEESQARPVAPNRDEDIRVSDPSTDDQREEVAEACVLRLAIEMPVVVDKVDDAIASAYGALPDRLYLVGKGGRVAWQGGPGPFEFKPEALEAAIRAELDVSATVPTTGSDA